MDYKENRKANLMALVDKYGSVKDLVDAISARLGVEEAVNPKYLAQILSGFQGSKDRRPRSLGDIAAARIEKGLRKPANWMDQDHTSLETANPVEQGARQRTDALPGAVPIEGYHPDEALADGEVEIPALNVRVGAGGRIVTEEVCEERRFRYSADWLQHYGLKAENLFRFRVHGDSMDSILVHGAWVTVDRSRTSIQDGHAYILRSGEEIQVKFLFRRPDGGIIIRSHNPAWADVVVTASELEHVEVLGEVVESNTMWVKPVSHRRKDDIEP
jgi:phage repressor protein C with HTH and peptisase S24 domain